MDININYTRTGLLNCLSQQLSLQPLQAYTIKAPYFTAECVTNCQQCPQPIILAYFSVRFLITPKQIHIYNNASCIHTYTKKTRTFVTIFKLLISEDINDNMFVMFKCSNSTVKIYSIDIRKPAEVKLLYQFEDLIKIDIIPNKILNFYYSSQYSAFIICDCLYVYTKLLTTYQLKNCACNIVVREGKALMVDSDHNIFSVHPYVCGITRSIECITQNYLSMITSKQAASNALFDIHYALSGNASIPLLVLYSKLENYKQLMINCIIDSIDSLYEVNYKTSLFYADAVNQEISRILATSIYILHESIEISAILKLYYGLQKVALTDNLINACVLPYKILASMPIMQCVEEGFNSIKFQPTPVSKLLSTCKNECSLSIFLLYEANDYPAIARMVLHCKDIGFRSACLKETIKLYHCKHSVRSTKEFIKQLICNGITIKDIMS